MRLRRTMTIAAALVAAALLVALAWALLFPDALLKTGFAGLRAVAGLEGQARDVAGHRWVVSERPAGSPGAPTLVFVHGFTGSKENWYLLAHALDDRYRLVMPDLPGWGESERLPSEPYGFLAQAERLAAFIRNVSPGKPVVLIGHSMGGGIATLVAAGYPELVSHVALLDAAGVPFENNRFGVEVLAGRNPFEVRDRASLDRYLTTVFHRDDMRPRIPWPFDRAYIQRRTRDAAFEQQVLDRIGRSDETFLPAAEAGRIRQPTLLLWCRQDAVIDPSALARYAARIPQASRVLVDDCGHMSQMERPAEVAAAIDALIERGRAR